MISDLLPSAGDEKRHTKGESEYSLSQLSKLHSLTHTHSIPHSPSLTSLESNRTGCAIVDQVPSFFHENLSDERRRRRRRPHLRNLTSTPPPTLPPPRYRHPRKERPQQQHSAFQSGGIVWGGKSAPISSAIGPLEPLQQSARQQDTHPDSR